MNCTPYPAEVACGVWLKGCAPFIFLVFVSSHFFFQSLFGYLLQDSSKLRFQLVYAQFSPKMRWSNVLTAVAATWASSAAAQDADVTASGFGSSSCGFWQYANLGELASKLSANADIYLPGSAEFADLSQRWSQLEKPQVNVTVTPATENDVVQTVGGPPPPTPSFI